MDVKEVIELAQSKQMKIGIKVDPASQIVSIVVRKGASVAAKKVPMSSDNYDKELIGLVDFIGGMQ